MELKNKLGLGTVQFGLDYGINNPAGMVPYPEVLAIVGEYNSQVSLPVYDTALGYGASQQVLGKAFKELTIKNPLVVSKFSYEDVVDSGLTAAVEQSLRELQIESLYGFMAHNADLLIKDQTLVDELQNLKTQGLVKKTGVSAYFPAQVEYFLDNNIPLDLVQVPYNLFDQRFEPVFGRCKAKGIEIHTRSSFLQGLIFKELSFFKDYFLPLKTGMEKLRELTSETQETAGALALAFACSNENIDKVLIGVDNKNNLLNNFKSISSDAISLLLQNKEQLKQENENILLPFNWPQK